MHEGNYRSLCAYDNATTQTKNIFANTARRVPMTTLQHKQLKRRYKVKMPRFGVSSLLEIDESVTNNIPKNTQQSNKYIWKQFSQFCADRKFDLNETTTDESFFIRILIIFITLVLWEIICNSSF